MSSKVNWCVSGTIFGALLLAATLSSVQSIDVVSSKNENAVASRYHLRTRTSSFYERSKVSNSSAKKASAQKATTKKAR